MKRCFILIFLVWISGEVRAQNHINFAENIIPPGYDPTLRVAQFANIVPDRTMPPGRINVTTAVRHDWTTPQLMAKGITHWTRGLVGREGGDEAFRTNPLYAKKEYNNVPKIRVLFDLTGPNWWPNGFFNEEQARQKGREISVSARLWVGETMEGDEWVAPSHPLWGWFYDEVVTRYEARKAQDGVQYYIAHNYGAVGLPKGAALRWDSRAENEALYSNPVGNWPDHLYKPGNTLSRLNTIVQAVYLGAPEDGAFNMMHCLHQMEITRKLGKYAGMFLFNEHEWLDGFGTSINLPGGKFFRSAKAHLDPNIQIAAGFLSQEYGTILVEWGVWPGGADASKKPVEKISNWQGKDEWHPDDQTSPAPFPYYAENSSQPTYQFGSELIDLPQFGIGLWLATGAQVADGTPYYATYRKDGGAWINRTSNGSDLVAAFYEKRGVARVRIQGNKMMICYFDFYADNQPHTIEIQNPLNPSQTFIGTACGMGVHVVVVNI